MSGSIIECRRYYEGTCAGGPCDECKFDAVNEYNDMVAAIWGYRLLVVSLVAAIVCMAVLA